MRTSKPPLPELSPPSIKRSRMKRWLLAVDLDKCLLTSLHTVSERNRSTLELAVANGAILVAASGRLLPAIAPLLRPLPRVAAVVAANGAIVYAGPGDRIIFDCCLGHNELHALVAWSRANDHRVVLCSAEAVHSAGRDALLEQYLSRTRLVANTSHVTLHCGLFSGIHKVLVYPLGAMQCDERRLAMRLAAGPLSMSVSQTFVSDHGYVEVVPAEASKEAGIAHVMRALGIERLPVVAIGDGDNDVGMLRFADVAYAVSNACPAARAAADIVVAHHDADGVAEALLHFLESHQ